MSAKYTIHPNKLPNFPIGIFSLAIIITISTLFWFLYFGFNTSKVLEKIVTQDFKAIELRGEIMRLDEVLTMSARMMVATKDNKWEERYDHYDPILVNAINEASLLIPLSNLGETAKKTDVANIKLVNMERQAFALTKQGKKDAAEKILFGHSYEEQKNIYASGMQKYGDLLKNTVRYNLRIKIHEIYYTLIIVLLDLIFTITAWILTYRGITLWRKALEKTMAERQKAEIEAASLNEQLVIAARRAGMSEIATSVLHNIGNVLTSVNISTSMIAKKIMSCKISNLTKVAELIEQHKSVGDIEKFLTDDIKGQHLLGYLCALSNIWSEDKDYLLKEITFLDKHIQHIREIILKQNSLSTSLAITQDIQINELIEDALKLNQLSYEQAQINIYRKFSDIKKVNIDRIKLLQILVNLIKNSIESLIENECENKQIILTVREQDNLFFIIEITDNGIGISAENMKKIFTHGFTTKKYGHGFGLHASILAAQEMGGTLSVKNNDLDKGVTFILVLPYHPS